MSRWWRLAIVLALGAFGVLSAAPGASAHAGLEASDPAAGSQLATAPAQVSLSFTEPPDPSLSVIHVLDTNGTPMESGPAAAGDGPRQVTVPLPGSLPDGSYTVSWRVVSQADGHVTAGTFAFGVGTAPQAPSAGTSATSGTPAPTPLSIAAKILLYAGLALALGTAATGLWAFAGHVPARHALLPAAGALTLAGALLLLAAERATIGVSLSTLLRSPTGRPLIWLAVGAAATAVGTAVASRGSSRGALALAGIAAGLTMYARAEGGHAAAGGGLQVLLQWAHFLAAGVWIGGLVPVLLLLRERRKAAGPIPVEEVARYSATAGWAVLVLVTAGLARAVNELGGFDPVLHLFATSYGITLAGKVALALVLIALGAVNRWRSIPRLATGDGPLRRIMTVEVVGAVGVFALTGLLTGLAPNQAETMAHAPPANVTVTAADFATTMRVTLTATPGTPGPNAFGLSLADYDTGAPLPATGVTLRFVPAGRPGVAPSELALKADGEAWTGAGTNLSLSGAWEITARVLRGARTTEVPLTLSLRAPDQQVSVSSPTPGQPTLYTVTLPEGEQLQVYNDPGSAGANQLHLTAFDAQGQELPLAAATMVAMADEGTAQVLDATRFGPGHFVASVDLTTGLWHFDLAATAKDGTVLAATVDQTIGQTNGQGAG